MTEELLHVHLIIDTEAWEIFSDKNLYTQTLIPSLCERSHFGLHVLHSRPPGYMVHGYPWTAETKRTTCRNNESCACAREGCIRDAVLCGIDSESYIVAVIASPESICLATYADRIFATGLARNACDDRQYPHHPVTQWTDVERVLVTMTAEKRMIPRRQARLQRMDAHKSE